jgi:hypothetical protein
MIAATTKIERQPDAAADRRDGSEQRDAGRHLVLGELVAYDAEAQREHAAAEALQPAADDHQAEGAGEGADDRPEGEAAQGDRQQALLAEHVAEAAEDRRGDRGDEQVGGDHPGDVARRRAERALHVAQCRDDGRLGQHEAEQADAKDEEGPAGCLTCSCRVHGLLFLEKTK